MDRTERLIARYRAGELSAEDALAQYRAGYSLTFVAGHTKADGAAVPSYYRNIPAAYQTMPQAPAPMDAYATCYRPACLNGCTRDHAR